MKAHLLVAFGAIVFSVFFLSVVKAEYDVTSYCQLVKNGTKLPSLKSCHKYYTCLKENGEFVESSCEDSEFFDKNKQDCQPADTVKCFVPEENPCEGHHEIFMSDRKDCRLWHYCENGVSLGSATCPKGQKFDVHEQSCVYGTCHNINDDGSIELTNVCDIMPINMFFADFENCAFWHKCTTDTNKLSVRCPRGFIFDVDAQLCIPQNDNMCAGPAQNCTETENVNLKVPHNKICSVYFVCEQLFGEKYDWKTVHCPKYEYFDTKTNKCKPRQEAIPAIDCDRCEYSSSTWVNAVDYNCTKYLTCQNGQKVREGYCGENTYFNEQLQHCDGNINSLKDYRVNNGACNITSTEGGNSSGGDGGDPPGSGGNNPPDVNGGNLSGGNEDKPSNGNEGNSPPGDGNNTPSENEGNCSPSEEDEGNLHGEGCSPGDEGDKPSDSNEKNPPIDDGGNSFDGTGQDIDTEQK